MRLKTFEKELSLDEKMRYISHMNNLIRNIDCRFDDLFALNIPDFIIDPFNCNISEIDPLIQEDIIDIQNDSKLKILFKNKGYNKCWLNINEKYENICKLIK